MKIFISDLHLGDGSRTDDFHRDKEFLEFLKFVEDEAGELIILGDFLELWQADLDKVLFCHSKIINKILSLRSKLKVTYVIGNHDYIPFIRFINSEWGISLEYQDKEAGIVAEHGHRYDIFNRYKNPLRSISWPPGRRFTLFVAGLERFIHPDIDKWTKKVTENLDEFLQEAISVRNKIPPSTREYLRCGGHFGEFQEAVELHIQKGAKIVIFGHTHRAQLEQLDRGIYANCGAWVDGVEPTYISYTQDKIALTEAITHKTARQIQLKNREG